jgi:hypothetical protein
MLHGGTSKFSDVRTGQKIRAEGKSRLRGEEEWLMGKRRTGSAKR